MKTLILGASGELGRAISKCLTSSGHKLVLHGFANTTALNSMADELSPESVVVGDVSIEDETARIVNEATESLGALDNLVFAVGVNPTAARLADTTGEDWTRTISVNLSGAFFAAKSSIPILRRSELSPTIVFVSSIFGINSPPNRGAYSVSKHGITGLVQTLAKEEAPRIRVNGICPGAMWTENVRDIFAQHAESVGISVEEYVKERASRIPTGRFLKLEECASLVEYLTSEKSKFITGEMIRISGGES